MYEIIWGAGGVRSQGRLWDGGPGGTGAVSLRPRLRTGNSEEDETFD